jgi:hypothetical protein
MCPASWASLFDPRRGASNPRKHESCRGWARFQEEPRVTGSSAHTCFPRKAEHGRQRCPIDERRLQRGRAGAPDLPCPCGFNPGRLLPLKRHGDESGVQLACGTAGSNRLMDNYHYPWTKSPFSSDESSSGGSPRTRAATVCLTDRSAALGRHDPAGDLDLVIADVPAHRCRL